MHRLRILLTVLGALSFAHMATAQDWPARPITMIVPFAAGGPAEITARTLASGMSNVLGQQIVIENVGGAGGTIGSARVAKAAADGYQFLYGSNGTHAASQTLFKNPPFHAVKDFAPVGLFTTSTRVLIVRKDLPVANLPDFVAYAKANQARMTFGSSGVGGTTHLACLLLHLAAGIDVTHVPYRGTSLAMQDLVASRIDYLCDATQSALPHIQAGTVKAIAVLSSSRASVLPRLATAQEQGFANIDADAWAAFFFPKDTAEIIVRKLNRVMNETLEQPAVQQRLESAGYSIVPAERRTPEYLATFVPAEIKKWAPVIKASGVPGN
jgi:tripartite-type tricarboxylate transporter receptor subunit TctC